MDFAQTRLIQHPGSSTRIDRSALVGRLGATIVNGILGVMNHIAAEISKRAKCNHTQGCHGSDSYRILDHALARLSSFHLTTFLFDGGSLIAGKINI